MEDPRDAAARYVLTGAPGAGKTAILEHLGADVRCVGEPAREILAEQRASGGGGTPDQDPSLFVDLLLRRSIAKHEAAREGEGPVLFDRGVPDCVAYASYLGVDPTASRRACAAHRYHREVLILEPWEAIYTTDDERTMTFADTLAFHDAVRAAYAEATYALVEVPRGSVGDRAAFVRAFILSSA